MEQRQNISALKRYLRRLMAGLAFVLPFVLHVTAQDIHFTQFFSTPLILNPAQTGYYEGNYRIGFNFKAQWPWAIQGKVYNYHSETPYVDFSFGEKKIRVGWMGIGFNFLNDEAGDGFLTYRRFGLSYAYHQALDKDHRYMLSAGVAVNYIIRSVDFSKFYFNDQWVEDVGFVTSIDPREPVQKDNFSMADLSAGIKFEGHVHNQVKIDGGLSMLHLNRPRHSFLGTDERLGLRYQANLGIEYNINERITISAQGYYGYEKKANEIIVGTMLGYGFYNGHKSNIDHILFLGLYYRAKDALTPSFGYQYKKTRLIVSYDATLSGLLVPGKANGGPEISLVHIGSWEHSYNGKKLYCPNFAR